MKSLFLVLSVIFIFASVTPYVIDILKGKTKPNIVSWLTWTMLTLAATIAEIAAKEYVTAIVTAASAASTLIIVLLGLYYGHAKYSTFDIVCQVGVILGFVLWYAFNSPLAAVLAALVIDFIGALPTVRHSWLKPHEETWVTFVISSIGALFAIFALNTYSLISLSYPIYLLIMNAIIAFVIVYRLKSKTDQKLEN